VNIADLGMFDGGSTLNGSSPINITNQFTWSNGSIRAGGAIASHGTTVVNPTSSARTLSRPLNNYGAMTIRGPFSLSSTGPINNMPGGLIDLQYENSSIGISGVINNDGMMIKTTSAGTAGLPNVVNTGTIDVQVGGISFHTTYVGLTQTAGETILNDTSIEMIAKNRPFDLQGGVLKGNGTVIGELDNSGGAVTPGFSVGEIQVDDYIQGVNGVLEIEIGEPTPGVTHDRLIVTGSADLGGTLLISLINSYTPNPGNSWVVLTAGSLNGTFAQIIGPGNLSVTYVGNEVLVTVNEEPCGPIHIADLDADCDVDLDDAGTLLVCLGGPKSNTVPACASTDLDDDAHTDLRDFSIMQRCFSGPDALATCGE
jgi:hypothetical protein